MKVVKELPNKSDSDNWLSEYGVSGASKSI